MISGQKGGTRARQLWRTQDQPPWQSGGRRVQEKGDDRQPGRRGGELRHCRLILEIFLSYFFIISRKSLTVALRRQEEEEVPDDEPSPENPEEEEEEVPDEEPSVEHPEDEEEVPDEEPPPENPEEEVYDEHLDDVVRIEITLISVKDEIRSLLWEEQYITEALARGEWDGGIMDGSNCCAAYALTLG